LEQHLRGLRSDRGEPLVSDVIRVAPSVETAMDERLPDLVVHWSDAVFASPLRIAGSKVKGDKIGEKYVGQHSLEGFCIVKSTGDVAGDEVRAEDLHSLITSMLDCPRVTKRY
jgi:hypothetical protein